MSTLSEVLSVFLKVDRSAYTNRNYELCLAKMVNAIGGGRDIHLVTYPDLLDYTIQIKPGITQSTFKQYVTVVKTFFNWSVRARYLDWSPAAQLTARKPPTVRLEERAIPGDALESAMELAYSDPRDYAILSFIRGTAARTGGVASLRLGNLDLVRMQAWIENKGGDYYWAFFGENTANALRRYLEVRPQCDHDFVFVSKNHPHAAIKKSTYAAIVVNWTIKVGSRAYRPHSIRHRTTQDWDDNNFGVTILRDKLNHANIDTTNNYVARQNPQVRIISQQMDKRHKSSEPPAPKSPKILYLDDAG